MCVCVHARVSSVVSDILQPHVAQQAPLSTEFSRQEYWSGLPFPSPGDLPDPVIMEQIKTQKQCFPRWDEGGVRGDLAASGLPGCGGHGALPHRPDPAGPPLWVRSQFPPSIPGAASSQWRLRRRTESQDLGSQGGC